MKKLLICAAILIFAGNVNAACSSYCNPEKSKPCGGGCVALAKNCRQPWTTACAGINPTAGSGKIYASPTKVEQRPDGTKKTK